MSNDSDKHRRRSIRLRGYDYSRAGTYFVTVCTHDRALLFENEEVRQIAERCWLEIPGHFAGVALDAWVLMPNHLHGVVLIGDEGDEREPQGGEPKGVQLNAPTNRGAGRFSRMSPHRGTLGVIIRTYKAAVTTSCRKAGYRGFRWQRNYHEHVLRSEADLQRVRRYIGDNPLQWELDEYYPGAA